MLMTSRTVSMDCQVILCLSVSSTDIWEETSESIEQIHAVGETMLQRHTELADTRNEKTLNTLQMVCLVTQYTHFNKAFFAFTRVYSTHVEGNTFTTTRKQKKWGFSWAYSHKTHKCSRALCADTAYRISPKSVKQHERCGSKLSYVLG
jgi:hypothetical protein